jgi:hypothetical protein
MADTWRVTSQRQTEELNPAGTGFETVWIVTYQVTAGPAQGATGQVSVPAAQYSADTVRQLIEDQVAAITDVASL